MSSVEDKKNMNTRVYKSLLIRKGSLDKFKCTAYATIGSIFSKKSSLIHILENALNSSRTAIQMPVATIIIPSIHVVCVAMSILVNLIRKNYSGGMSFENLDKFIIEFNQLKSERRRRLKHKSTTIQQSGQIRRENHETETDKNISSETQKTVHNAVEKEEEEFHECIDKKMRSEKDKNILRVASIVSIAIVYSQLLMLFYMIGLSTFKLGMLFMLICIAAIAYFILKISFTLKKSERKSSGRVKTVRHKLIGKALTFTSNLPYKFKFPWTFSCGKLEKQKSL